MDPSAAERDELLKGFARALFRNDVDALYRIVVPDFVWSFHDGLLTTKALAGPAAIREHLAEQKARFSAQRFHEVAYHHAADATFMTFRVSETVKADGEQREQRHRVLYVQRRHARDQGCLSQADQDLILEQRPYRLSITSHSQRATASGDDAPSPPAARRLASRMTDMSILPSSGASALRNA